MLRGATAAAAAAAIALAATGCGDASDDGDEQAASYRVSLPQTTFPARQQLAHPVEMTIAVRNASDRTIPNVTATLATGGDAPPGADAFGTQLDDAGLASRTRPVWIVDEGPVSGDTAYANTWALGSLGPGDTREFTWRVVPVRAGSYELRYRLTGSTTGRSQLRMRDGSVPQGSFTVRVSGKPSQVRVTPDGRIVSVPG
jgi:hypothetical protein